MPLSAEILRDQWGIPYIRAADTDAVFYANGYVHAQDRLWQMDAARRRAVGRYAEWVGREGLAADMLARRLGVAQASLRDYEHLSAETRRMLECYARGVNDAMEQLPLPVEYGLLGERPQPWEPWHCVAVMRQRGLLMGSIWFKLWRAAAIRRIGPQAVGLLRYEDGGTERFVVPQTDSESRRWIAGLEALAPSIEAVLGMAASDATVAGSNNWAVSGAHTASGRPLVAGDPHRAFEIPSMYSQLHLSCDEFDALGFSVPGVPAFPHFCHTEHVAWCVTHAFADIHDLYLERFDPGDPLCYATENGTERAQVRSETIHVRGGQDVTIQAVQTRHGPVITDAAQTSFGVALRSVQLDPVDRSLDCLLPMLRARGVEEFNERCRPWGVIDHSVVSADTQGRISVNVRAIVPERDRANGWLPVPGWTGEHEWRGYIPWERMPRLVDPPSGRLVTANNRIVPDGQGDYLCTDCHPSTRARRIDERLGGIDRAGVADMRAVLADTSSARAVEIAARIAMVHVDDAAAQRLLDMLAQWDGNMDPGAQAPSAYYLVRQEMTRILARRSGLDAAADDIYASMAAPGVVPVNQLWWTLPDLLRRDDTSLLAGATWDEVIREALLEVAGDETIAPWGELHRPVFAHPLASVFPEQASRLAPASQPVGGDGDCVSAHGAYPSGGPAATYGPVARYVFDVGDWDNSRWVVFHGASGVPGSAHYGDQNALWAKCELAPAPFSRAAVDAAAVSRQEISQTVRNA
ncbi:penicillin acylase family protein [Candidimonas humi]|uniref:Penicillin acylase family protein n=1 Tax=Candidimonas humi TaxID=683355 RepID=A0ABV8NZP8_9BURK|nr:penicillin acylase family protein [Candidimonas humi]MBV6306338.1 penicillin acylase family protein [Candidimonas humi]